MNYRLPLCATLFLTLAACAPSAGDEAGEAEDLIGRAAERPAANAPGSAIQFYRAGAGLTPKSTDDGLTTFVMSRGEFEIRFPKLTNEAHLRVVAWDKDTVNIEEGASVDAEDSPFGAGKGMATAPGSIILDQKAHNYLIGDRVRETDDGRLAAPVKELSDGKKALDTLSHVYLTTFLDKNDNRIFDQGEYASFKIEFTAEEPAPTTPDSTPAPTGAKPSSVKVSWNRVSPTAEYSFDVFLQNGDLIGPCVDAAKIEQDLSFEFKGKCTSPNIDVPVKDIRDFRICSAERGDWATAICTDAHWDGTSAAVKIAN